MTLNFLVLSVSAVLFLLAGHRVVVVDGQVDCNKAGSCFLQNIGVVKDLLVQAQSMQNGGSSPDPNATDVQMQKMCASFQPIIDCTGRDAAVQCEYRLNKRGAVFRLYYLTFLCSVTLKMRQCNQTGLTEMPTTPAPRICPGQTQPTTTLGPTTSPGTSINQTICSLQFPDVEGQLKDMSKKNTTLPSLPDDPYAVTASPDDNDDSLSFMPTFTDNCDRTKLYVGCWLHLSKGKCGNKAGEIIEQMYAIYNDLSGKKCSSGDPRSVNYTAFEEAYLRQYVTTPAPCPTQTTASLTRALTGVAASSSTPKPSTKKATTKKKKATLAPEDYDEYDNTASQAGSVFSVLASSIAVIIFALIL